MGKTELIVDPGVCGFTCRIRGWQEQERLARVEILESQCGMINKLSASIEDIAVKDLFLPLTRNPVFVSAERAGCHTACPVPVAVVKVLEIVLGLAVPKAVSFRFPDIPARRERQ